MQEEEKEKKTPGVCRKKHRNHHKVYVITANLWTIPSLWSVLPLTLDKAITVYSTASFSATVNIFGDKYNRAKQVKQ